MEPERALVIVRPVRAALSATFRRRGQTVVAKVSHAAYVQRVKWKIAAALAVSVLIIGAMPVAAGDLAPDAPSAAVAGHGLPYGVLQASHHVKRSFSLRDLAVGVQPFQLPRPTSAVGVCTGIVQIAPAFVRNRSCAIRGPPLA